MFHVIHTHKSSPRTSHMPHIRFASFGISSVRPLCFLSARKKKLGHKTPMPRIASASAVWFTRSRQAFGFTLPRFVFSISKKNHGEITLHSNLLKFPKFTRSPLSIPSHAVPSCSRLESLRASRPVLFR